ncbi:uncharacterized protein LOC125497575 [Beta vulgaris subsp. vulgaris]|uniref:uncharacterized protein LOC125497575 n=1 Tax=Beta vulgaris subsp. vulgaris TaxID=3555 RepID=UPI002036E314|nr:uncharacterized protein LOC125497575 [Beta vulgaris subsp. vulgaris]
MLLRSCLPELIGPFSGLELPCTGRKPGDSSIGSSERWGSCKLRSTDSKSADSRKFYSSQSPYTWKNPGYKANLRSTPNSEHDGIRGSWSASKLPSAGSKVPTIKLPDNCLLVVNTFEGISCAW